MNGWRPISVTYQPATVATQPEKVIAAQATTAARAAGRSAAQPLRRHSHQPTQLVASISTPDADHHAEGPEHRRAPAGARSRKSFEPLHLAVEVVASGSGSRASGSAISKWFSRAASSGIANSSSGAPRVGLATGLPSRRSSAAGVRACSGHAGRRRRSAAGSAAPPA